MLSQALVLIALMTSPITIGVLVLWSAHRGYVASGGQS
jgi:hypothetical protein